MSREVKLCNNFTEDSYVRVWYCRKFIYLFNWRNWLQKNYHPHRSILPSEYRSMSDTSCHC